MLTQNIDKRALVQQLLDSRSITAEQAYMLLDEPAPSFSIDYNKSFPQPVYPYEWGKVYVGDFGHDKTGCITLLSGCTATTIGNGTTDTVHYTQEQWNEMLRSGMVHYTA